MYHYYQYFIFKCALYKIFIKKFFLEIIKHVCKQLAIFLYLFVYILEAQIITIFIIISL